MFNYCLYAGLSLKWKLNIKKNKKQKIQEMKKKTEKNENVEITKSIRKF